MIDQLNSPRDVLLVVLVLRVLEMLPAVAELDQVSVRPPWVVST